MIVARSDGTDPPPRIEEARMPDDTGTEDPPAFPGRGDGPPLQAPLTPPDRRGDDVRRYRDRRAPRLRRPGRRPRPASPPDPPPRPPPPDGRDPNGPAPGTPGRSFRRRPDGPGRRGGEAGRLPPASAA